MAQSPPSFIIFHRNIHGNPDFVYPYDGRLAACVTTSINIARAYIRSATVQAAFESFARDLNRSAPQNAWYNDPVHGCGGPRGAVLTFVEIILAVFPLIGIDDTQRNQGCLGFVAKRPWKDRFDPLDNPIVLNGPVRGHYLAPEVIVPNKAKRDQRIYDMVEAATRARHTMNKNDYENRQLRTFNFIFANCIFHELCHLFSNFLTKGRIFTPPQFTAAGGYSGQHRGEAGRYMESILFGGTLKYFRDHSRGDKQSGLPYIYKENNRVQRIPQETIDAVTNYRFHFPYPLEGPIFNSEDFETLGRHQARDHLTDPMKWPIMQHFKNYKHTVTFHPRPDFKRPSYPPGYE